MSAPALFANRFEIEQALGSGGMGTVYRARDQYSGRTVALKIPRAAKIPDPAARLRYLTQVTENEQVLSRLGRNYTPPS